MKIGSTPYDKQIFVCTNDKKGEGASCGDQQGETIFRELRQIAKDRKLHPRIRSPRPNVWASVTPDATSWFIRITSGTAAFNRKISLNLRKNIYQSKIDFLF